MNIPTPFKVILILVTGLLVLWGLSVLASSYIYSVKNENSISKDDYVVTDSGSVEPSIGAPDSRALLYYPGYYNEGDGSKLVLNGVLNIKVSNIEKTSEDITTHVKDVKGYVQMQTESGTVNNRSTVMVIRVPSSEFENTLKKLKDMAVEVVSSSSGSSDVSGTYQDIETRLKTQKALEKQLLQLLNKATQIEDILKLQTELSNVRGIIESYEIELKNYDQKVSMSTISVSISKASEAYNVVGDSWKPFGVFKEALTSFVDFLKGLVNVAIWALVFSPVILVPAGLVYFYRRFRK